MAAMTSNDDFTIRKKYWTFFGASFHVLNAHGQVIAFCRQKAFKLREDIRLCTDEALTTELLAIKARHIVDFSASYDVFDSADNEKVGMLKRKGLSSLLRDSWILCDACDAEIGTIREDSLLLAQLRRQVTTLIPQTFIVESDGVEIARMKQNVNPFIQKLHVTSGPLCTIDPRLLLAASVLVAAIEGRQQ